MTDAKLAKWLTPVDLADLLGVSTAWVQEQVTAKALPHHRVGRLTRFSPTDVAAIEKTTAVTTSVTRLRTTA